jgi:transcriptional regulator with XRE-family HTH domain
METMGAVEFGQYFRNVRRQADVKQAVIAERLGVSQPAISDIERGDRKDFSQEDVERSLRAIAEASGMDSVRYEAILSEGMAQAGLAYIPKQRVDMDDRETGATPEMILAASPAAKLLGIPADRLSAVLQKPEIVAAMRLVAERGLPEKVLLQWETDSAKYFVYQNARRQSRLVRKRTTKTNPEQSGGTTG